MYKVNLFIYLILSTKNMNKKINQKTNNYMANDMTDEVTQHEYNKNKYYENTNLYNQKNLKNK